MSALESVIAQQLSSGAARRGRYAVATGAAHRLAAASGAFGSTSNLDAAAPLSPLKDTNTTHDVDSREKLAELAAPLIALLSPIAAHDAVGTSVQAVVVEHNASLFIPFIAAQETRATSVLLWDQAASNFVGMMTVSDFIRILVDAPHATLNGQPTTLSALTQASIAEVRRQPWFSQTPVMNAARRPRRDLFGTGLEGTPRQGLIFCNVDATLFEALHVMITNGVATVPLLYNQNQKSGKPHSPAPSAQQTSSFGIAGLLTLPMIVAQIVRTLADADALSVVIDRQLGAPSSRQQHILSRPLCALPLVNSILNTEQQEDGSVLRVSPPFLSYTDPVARALEMFLEYGLNVIAVVDETGIIVDTVSRGDVLRMECCGTYDVHIPLRSGLGFIREAPPVISCCHMTDELGDVLCHFAHGKFKEVFVVDPNDDSLVGYLSLRSVLTLLCAIIAPPGSIGN